MMEFPEGFEWRHWVDRWDRMQDRYLVARGERFDAITRLIKALRPNPRVIADLGCGTGTLSLKLLDSFPATRVIGIDMDTTLLPLAAQRCASHGVRVDFILSDLRTADWHTYLPTTLDAFVSATALHWMNEERLAALYGRIAQALNDGGVFLNADHVGSRNAALQKAWEDHREELRKAGNHSGEDWSSFWSAYLDVLGPDAKVERERALGSWEGIESGLPLSWHFDALAAAGFSHVECFWRSDCDAVYGAIK